MAKENKTSKKIEEKTETKKDILKLDCLKLDKKVWETFFYDILFYASVLAVFLILALLLKNVLSNLQNLDYSNILTTDSAIANANLNFLQTIFVKMIGVILLFLICFLLLFSFFKSQIWTKLTEAKFDFRYYYRSVLMNLIYGIVFVILAFYFAAELKNPTLIIVLLPIFMHFNALSYYFLSRDNKVFKSIGKSFKFTIYKFTSYILPYILIILLFFYVLAFITQKILSYTLSYIIPPPYYQFISLIFIVFYFSIFRNYFVNLVNSIEHEKKK